MRGKNISDNLQKTAIGELRPEYDFEYSKGIRGKYYRQLLEEGATVVLVEPDIAERTKENDA
jgi:hypothetical protein